MLKDFVAACGVNRDSVKSIMPATEGQNWVGE
jgi:hypothetical protein